MSVVQLGKEPIRALVVRATSLGGFRFQVAPMERGRNGKPATYIGHSFGATDADEALQCAIGLRGKSGLPVVDLTRREPPQVAA
jgi:hypothetical protein